MHPIFTNLLERYPDLSSCAEAITGAAELLLKTAQEGRSILICGNGGSAADADHICGELVKSFCKKRPIDPEVAAELTRLDPEGAQIASRLQGGVRALSLAQHPALTTAFGNDVDPHLAFAQQCHVYGQRGDLFWGISTSGNATNVCAAALVARAQGLSVLGMTGLGGGKLKGLSDVCINVPRTETYEIQELHLPVYHALCLFIEDRIW